MNKKGFTLIELLSVIVLIGLLLGIGIPGVKRISDRMKQKSLNTKIKLVEQAATLWGQDNKTRLQADTCTIDETNYKCNKVNIKSLIEDDYVASDNNNEVFENPTNGVNLYKQDKCFVYVYKKNNRVYAKFNINQDECKENT